MGTEKEIDTWDKIVYLFKGIFLLGVSSYGMSSSADLIELIEGDSGARSHGEEEGVSSE
ncbi:hypothetical protein Aple_096000 [Acrocarpospora pleiomorpha]|uniref:Uncharacterized protein n=1 Tax=Acrocarpospora pleiomorpha TaxID=90975 RepID=A0A5M3Y4B5_9ACTN|nr:hypothetical protein [Acrocarpospora pleiomorpha]GES26701.1 hypothetical protein Aple_096000 [Acrocarpospora pleiomorpha]